MIRCNEIGQYIAHLKAIFTDNCKHIKPKDLEMMIDLMDAIRRCGKDGGDGGELPEDIVLYTPQEKEEYEKAIARLNIGAVSTDDVIQLLEEHLPDLLEILGVEFIINKQNNLNKDGTGTKYPTVDAVNQKFEDIEDQMSNVSGDKNFVYEQMMSSNIWDFTHPLEKKPSVTTLDSAGSTIMGKVTIMGNDRVIVEFNHPMWGKAILN